MNKIDKWIYDALKFFSDRTLNEVLEIKSQSAPLEEKSAEILADKPEANRQIEITFLDIGQGDASFIEWPDGEQMLVDCAKDARILEALGRVMNFYDRQIDYLLVTHPDLDHYGGCTDVLERFEVENIIYTGLQKGDASWEVFWQTVQEEGARYYQINEEEEWPIGDSNLHFLFPDYDVNSGSPPFSLAKDDTNNLSLVFMLSLGGVDVLFTGDMEDDLEKYLIGKYGDLLDAEILKVGHHGSGGSSSQEFLDIVTPELSTISVGADNKYGHPSLRVIRRLERQNSSVWRTDRQGDIKLYLDTSVEKGYTLDSKHNQ